MSNFAGTFDWYSATLHEKSGFNKRIIQGARQGTPEQPSTVLEVNANVPRQFNPEDLVNRNLVYWTMGKERRDLEKVIVCPDFKACTMGLETPGIREQIDALSIGSVILTHVDDVMDAKLMSEFILSSLALLPEGGTTYVCKLADQQEEHKGAYEAIRTVQKELGFHIRVNRSLIAPLLSRAFEKSLRHLQWGNRCLEIMMTAEKENNLDVVFKELPQDMPTGKPMTVPKVLYEGGRITSGHYCDEVFILQKLTEEQAEKRRQKMREQRRKERRKNR